MATGRMSSSTTESCSSECNHLVRWLKKGDSLMRVPVGTTIGTIMGIVLALPAAARADDTSSLDEINKPFLKDKPYLGLVIGITRPEGHQIRGYGQVTLNGKQQVPAGDTFFEIGSITKVF